MSAEELTQHPWKSAKTIDANTKLQTKLSVLLAIAAAAYAVGTWKSSTDRQGYENATSIAALAAKVDVIDRKVDALSDKVDSLRYDVRRANIQPTTAMIK